MRILKYPIEVFPGKEIIKLPKNSRILSCKTQRNLPFLWALVHPDETEEESWEITKMYTGSNYNLLHTSDIFLDTVLCINGELVIHIFYRKQ